VSCASATTNIVLSGYHNRRKLPAVRDRSSCSVLQLYVTDDDIVQTSASISRAFALMQQFGLLLAQPSLCSPFESATWQNPLYKDARLILQYTTFVEIMVPMFNMNFFTSKVIATLEHAETGTASACRKALQM